MQSATRRLAAAVVAVSGGEHILHFQSLEPKADFLIPMVMAPVSKDLHLQRHGSWADFLSVQASLVQALANQSILKCIWG